MKCKILKNKECVYVTDDCSSCVEFRDAVFQVALVLVNGYRENATDTDTLEEKMDELFIKGGVDE